MDGLGLIIDDTLDATLAAVPVAFGAPPDDLPPSWMPPLVVENQVQTSSCAGHAEALFFSLLNYVDTGEVLRFSRWFAYLTAQQASGQFFGRDGGTSITSTLLAATNTGCCLEKTLPFPGRYVTTIPKAAFAEAAKIKHHGDTRFDCRDWDTMLAWLTDHRPIIIGTRWHSGQGGCTGIEDKRVGSSGQFRGYHARTIMGWETHDGELVPVVQNSHGTGFGDQRGRWGQGRTIVLRDLWEWWKDDSSFFALGANDVDEVEPARRDWSGSKPGDCV